MTDAWAHGLVYAPIWTVFNVLLEYMHFYQQGVQQKTATIHRILIQGWELLLTIT